MSKKISLKNFAAQQGTQEYIHVHPNSVADHVAKEYIEINPTIKNEQGHHPARLTPAGVAKVTGVQSSTEGSSMSVSEKPTIEIESGVELPPNAPRGGQKVELYPFSKLEVGQSFFVPATEKNPNPAKSFASTVGSAQRRFGEKTGQTKVTPKGKTVDVIKPTRKFVLRAAEKNGVQGARVFRIA